MRASERRVGILRTGDERSGGGGRCGECGPDTANGSETDCYADAMSFDWDWIADNMAVGTWPETTDNVNELVDAGITHCLNVREIDDISQVQTAFTYLWNPTADWTLRAALGLEPKPVSWFKASLDFWMNEPEFWRLKRKLYCHCTQGVNRSATTVWMFLRALQLKHGDCSMLLDSNRLVDLVGEVIDRTWRSDAESALIALGYLP